MGLNSGEVVLGRIGDDLHMEYTALGHTVGLAARMEQLAAPGTVYVTEHTARLVEGFFALHDRGTPAMKGVSAPVRVYELGGPGTLKTRLDVSRRRGFSRLVGREGELARLWRALERALANDGTVVGVVGDAGVGKSRVCFEFVERCRAQGVAVHEAHCPTHGAALPFLAVRDLVRSLLGLAADDPASDARAVVRDRLVATDAELVEAAPLVLELFGIPDADPLLGDGASRGAALTAFVADLVHRLGARAPLVLLIDDTHCIDPASDEIMRAVAGVVPGTHALVLANFRPSYDATWIADDQRIALEPLGQGATHALLLDLLGDDESVRELFDVIAERTAGNPFFIEEVVQALAANGSLAGRAGAHRLAAPVESLAIPETVQSLLAARIDRLSPEAKAVLQTAAILGKQFDRAVLADVAGLHDGALGAALLALAESEFVHELPGQPGTRFAFRHPLTQEVAYHSQLAERRTRLHQAVAIALEKLLVDRLGENAELIAHHWEAAGRVWAATRCGGEPRCASRTSWWPAGGGCRRLDRPETLQPRFALTAVARSWERPASMRIAALLD
jgi:predicted ATPase